MYFKLRLDHVNSCADDKALYIEHRVDNTIKYFKLVPTEVNVEEYNKAWDYSAT